MTGETLAETGVPDEAVNIVLPEIFRFILLTSRARYPPSTSLKSTHVTSQKPLHDCEGRLFNMEKPVAGTVNTFIFMAMIISPTLSPLV
jgi:hypothetical protein